MAWKDAQSANSSKKEPEFTFKIEAHLETLSEKQGKDGSKWTRELNLVSFNGKDPLYDIRDWNSDHTRMGKGIRLTRDEMDVLAKFFTE